MPLGSTAVHQSAPLVRSALLAGYPDCGKRLLVDAVVAESGAVLFDLSPENTAGKYPGKKGLNMLIHLVSKVTKVLHCLSYRLFTEVRIIRWSIILAYARIGMMIVLNVQTDYGCQRTMSYISLQTLQII